VACRVRSVKTAFITAEDVLKALARYTNETTQTDRRTAAMMGIKRATLRSWIDGTDPPEKLNLARVAGFLRRAGYL
jgi:hypothetical protein